MVDINYTLFVQLGNFIFLIIVLNFLLLKPVMKHLAEREEKIKSSHDDAKANAERAEAALADFDHELADARLKANQAYTALQQEGAAVQRERVNAAKAEAQKEVDAARAEIASEASKARDILQAEMERLPKDIAAKLLGRTI
ncbi:MAG: ATP synthase F0 subunit B [Nitrospirae bacterium]|nr:ATP synthase F0 subunit B [Nitrospirota bacterium]